MKHHLGILSVALVLLLCSCSRATKQITDPSPEESTLIHAAYSCWRSQDAPGVFFAETELGCYNLADGFLYFAPAGSTEFQLLCSRPDCTHEDEDCNAYAGDAFTYYNGYLYGTYTYMNSGNYRLFQKLVRISPDGSGHEDVGNLENATYPNGSSSCATDYIFFDQYLYYTIISEHPGETGYESHLFRMSLTTGENEALPVSEESARCTGGYYAQFDGGKWYFLTGQILPDGSETKHLACVDMDSGTFSLLAEGDNTRFSRFTVEDGVILYFQPGRGFCQLDTETGEDRCVSTQTGNETGEIYRANYDCNFIYCDAKSSTDQYVLQIYDREYHLVDAVARPSDVHFITATQDYILFGFYPPYGTGMVPTAYINKSDIGTGNLELISIDG